MAKDLVKIFEPFNKATTFLSYEKNVSISSVFPILYGQLKPSNDSTDSTVICQFKETFSQKIKRRCELDTVDVTSPLLLTSALDPHFRQLTFTKLENGDLEEKI